MNFQIKRLVSALLVAGLFGVGTLALGRFAVLSDNPVLAAAQRTVSLLLLPGLIGAMGVSGNVHAFEIWVAAVINGLLYFGVTWLACTVFARLSERKPTSPH